jgi:ribonuclease T
VNETDDDTFFSVDCETSGPFPGRHALLSVGVVVVHRERGLWTLGDSLYREWAPPEGAEEDPAATNIHRLDLAALRTHGVDAAEGARELARWVSGQGTARRVFVGYNAAFDWAFVLHALGAAHATSPFHHAPLDLKSAIWGAYGGSWREHGNLETLEHLVGQPIKPEGSERPHNAVDDARLQARALIHLLGHLEAAGRV